MEMEPGKLFIGGISWDTSEELLREYFQTFGEVVEAVIMKDRTTGRARGFGFIVFASASVAEKVVRERHIINGRTVEAKKAIPRDDNQNFNRNNGIFKGSPVPARTKKIFVGGLASTVTESDFKKYFDQFGTIKDVVVMYDHITQRPRGFGFITYDSEKAVDKVLVKTFHELNGKMVEVKQAVPKELSPGPARSQFNGYYNCLNRVSILLNQNYNLSSAAGNSVRMDGRFSPVTVGRNEYPRYSPSKDLDSGFISNYVASGDSSLGHGHRMDSYYSGNSNRYDSAMAYDVGYGGSGVLLNTANQSVWGVWGNASLNYGTNSMSSSAFVSSVSGNAGVVGRSGSIGEIWGSSPISEQGGVSDSLNSGDPNYGIGEKKIARRAGYGRSNGSIPGTTSSSNSVGNNVHEGVFGDLYGVDAFYGQHAWRTSTPELEDSASFVYGLGIAAADVRPDSSVGYAEGYRITARSNRGIAA